MDVQYIPMFLVILDHSSEFLGRSCYFSFPPVVASVEFETLVATRSGVSHLYQVSAFLAHDYINTLVYNYSQYMTHSITVNIITI